MIPKAMTPWQAITLLEPLHRDDKSWFKQFEVCAATNESNTVKMLLRVPTMLKGQVWGVFESLSDTETDT